MSFELAPKTGNTNEITVELEGVTQHEREANVIAVITKSIEELLETLGNEYLSVSANGKINPVAGESGDEIRINIQSLAPPVTVPVSPPEPGVTSPPEPLPAPISPVETPDPSAEKEIENVITKPVEVGGTEITPTPPVSLPVQPETGPENPPISETPPPTPTPPVENPTAPENPAENPPTVA